MSHGASEPIELRAHHHVDLAAPDSLWQRVEARATLPGPLTPWSTYSVAFQPRAVAKARSEPGPTRPNRLQQTGC